MSIQNEIERIRAAKEALRVAIEAKGGDVGQGRIETYAEAVSSLPMGGGAALTEMESEEALLAAMEEDEIGTLYHYTGQDGAHLMQDSICLLVGQTDPLTEGIAYRSGEKSLCSLTPGLHYPSTTYYTRAQIEGGSYTDENGRLLHLYAWGKTDSTYVVGAFNEDYSLLVLTRNGDDSDGLMAEIESSGTLHNLIRNHTRRIITGEGLKGALSRLSYATKLQKLQIAPNSFSSLADYSLCCDTFTELILPEGIEYLGRAAIQYCPNLTHLSLPSTFKDFTGTQTLTFNDCLTCITYRGTVAAFTALINEDTWAGASMGTNVVHCLDGDVTVSGWRAVAKSEVSA